MMVPMEHATPCKLRNTPDPTVSVSPHFLLSEGIDSFKPLHQPHEALVGHEPNGLESRLRLSALHRSRGGRGHRDINRL